MARPAGVGVWRGTFLVDRSVKTKLQGSGHPVGQEILTHKAGDGLGLAPIPLRR